MPRKPTPKPWTEVEDYFLAGNAGRLTTAEFAEKLGRKPEEVAARVSELKLGGRVAAERLKGFATHPSGAVSMTHGRAFEDDKKAGKVPAPLLPDGEEPPAAQPDEGFAAKYKNCIHKLF